MRWLLRRKLLEPVNLLLFRSRMQRTSGPLRDFLAIPDTSVSVGRLFSLARHLCYESRVMLSRLAT
ncbi:hypothetical protein B0H19DRAFT_593801 [Mycena capillaripes]|nr:hypothetical protein B0H19DRAFT_593801 [Mycena capillaripes]